VGYGQRDEKFRQYFEKSKGKRRKEDVAAVRNITLNYVNINSYINRL
jgi:hypothetical protein